MVHNHLYSGVFSALVFLAAVHPSVATTYYVAQNGKATNNGTAAAPVEANP